MITGILVDDAGDLMIRNGEIATGDSTMDMIERTIIAVKGEFKNSPQSGCNVRSLIGATTISGDSFKISLIEDLKRNNIPYKSITINEKGINVEAQ